MPMQTRYKYLSRFDFYVKICHCFLFIHWPIFSMQILNITDFFHVKVCSRRFMGIYVEYDIKNESLTKVQTRGILIEINERIWYDLCTQFPYSYLNSISSTTYILENHNIIFHDCKYNESISLQKVGVIFQFQDKIFIQVHSLNTILNFCMIQNRVYDLNQQFSMNYGYEKNVLQNTELILAYPTYKWFMNVIPVEYPCYPCK